MKKIILLLSIIAIVSCSTATKTSYIVTGTGSNVLIEYSVDNGSAQLLTNEPLPFEYIIDNSINYGYLRAQSLENNIQTLKLIIKKDDKVMEKEEKTGVNVDLEIVYIK